MTAQESSATAYPSSGGSLIRVTASGEIACELDLDVAIARTGPVAAALSRTDDGCDTQANGCWRTP